MLHGALDSRTDQCFMRKAQDSPIKLMTSPTGLYLISMPDICVGSETAMFQEVANDIPKSQGQVRSFGVSRSSTYRSQHKCIKENLQGSQVDVIS